MKAKQSPPYKPVVQMPHCCVPACLIMVLDRRNIAHGTQEDIGVELGLVVSSKNAHLFKKAKVDDSFEGKFGTQVDEGEHSVNNYFYNNNIQLEEKYFPAETIGIMKEFISENLLAGNDLLVCASNEVLYGKGSGHASLIQEIDGDDIILIDPGIDKPKIRKVKLDNLVEAMKANKRRGGFWVISDKKRKKPLNGINITDHITKVFFAIMLFSYILARVMIPSYYKLTSDLDESVDFFILFFKIIFVTTVVYSFALLLIRTIINKTKTIKKRGVDEKNN